MNFFNKVNPLKASLTIHVWFPRNNFQLSYAVLGGLFSAAQAANKNASFMQLNFFCHGHIALLVNDGKEKHYISWYPMQDGKRAAVGDFVSPQRDLAIWGAPNVTLHTKATKQTIQAAFDPLFMHYKKIPGSSGGLRRMPMDELRINTENSEFFSDNASSIFSLYRPFFDLYRSSVSVEKHHSVLQEHIKEFNFTKLARPYQAGHELSLFLMDRAGLPVNQVPGCYEGSVDLKQLAQALENDCSSVEIPNPLGTRFF